MRLTSSDPDVETIVSRIKNDDLNLQPDFQRGVVWTDDKKKKLVDSILRGWHIPPIHVVEVRDKGTQEVLDGQQRLTAILNFVNGRFTVDGHAEPLSNEIKCLHGLHFDEL
ncbi:MAG: DUF262 domain-containing protein, partial [Alphaproteobacteria bacterium]|nr:DUF262 domain-containing protein [Alphaproteobacteria bacterium]